MSTETEGGARPDVKRVRERTVADVAKEAFERRLFEGDRPADRKTRAGEVDRA